jgi:hypothetical protein
LESFDIKSYHRFIICSNNEDPIKTSDDDRRTLIIKCSPELCDKEKNQEYWIKMRKMINDPNAIKSIYNYLMSIPNLDNFHIIKLPKTQYHKDIIEKNESAELLFVKHLAGSGTVGEKQYRADEVIEKFNFFIKSIGKKEYNIDAPTLLLRISNLEINGITKKKTSICNLTVVDYDELRKHFNIPLECSLVNDIQYETD